MKTMLRLTGARFILAGGVLAAVVAGCGDDPVAVDPIAAMVKTGSTDNQLVAAGTVVPVSPEVALTTASGAKAIGAAVTFTVEGGGGTVDGGVVVTDSRGLARPREWTLGPIAGPNSLKATANGLEVTFTAFGIAGPAAAVVGTAGEEQTAPVNTEVAIPPEVRVIDQFGNGVGGEPVQWQIFSGGGTVIGNGSMDSGPDGLAQVLGWRLGPTPGENIIEAGVPGFPPVQFIATATGTGIP